jgi:hypothetical protein
VDFPMPFQYLKYEKPFDTLKKTWIDAHKKIKLFKHFKFVALGM